MRGHHVIASFHRDNIMRDLDDSAFCPRNAFGSCACSEPSPDSPRCYFTRVAVRGLRAIFEWDPAKRWPAGATMELTLIEGVAFRDAAAARRFDMSDDACSYEELFDTWDEAERWLGMVDTEREGSA
jgi:hypothetical protein